MFSPTLERAQMVSTDCTWKPTIELMLTAGVWPENCSDHAVPVAVGMAGEKA